MAKPSKRSKLKELKSLVQKMDGNSYNPQAEFLELLKSKCPEAFTEGKIDPKKLRQTLGEEVSEEGERYGLSWAGKSDCFRHIQEPTTATLKPIKKESIDFDKTENIFIEGDNLEVLKALQKSYYGSIKMIYIDPPYNTGNDSFIYPDRYKEEKEDYELRAGIKDAEGLLTKDGFWRKNSKDAGHFHSNWLSMMYPRLFFAKNLLREDGIIFVSIDDNEIHNLQFIMNEVFGEENFINLISVKVRESAGESGGGEDKRLKKHSEYLLMYAKHRETYDLPKIYTSTLLKTLLAMKETTADKFVYRDILVSKGERQYLRTIPDGKGNEIKIYKYDTFEKNTIDQVAKQTGRDINSIYKQYFEKIFTTYNARTSIRDRVREAVPEFDGLLEIEYVPKSGRYKGKLTKKYFYGKTKRLLAWLSEVAISDSSNEIVINTELGTLWLDISWATLASEGDVPFNDGKKPIDFIIRMLKLSCVQNEDLVLDFFAGSCSTAHAVMKLNAEEGGNRKFICVQIAEPLNPDNKDHKEAYDFCVNLKLSPNVAEIGKERIRRAAKKIAKESKGNLDFDKTKLDLGFKVFKLEQSNFKQWREDIKTGEELKEQMKMFVDNTKKESRPEDMLYEIILKNSRFDLNVKISKESFDGVDYYRLVDGVEIICLAPKITRKFVDKVLVEKPERFTCLDIAFKNNDQLKTNTALQMEAEKIEFKVI